MNPKKGTYPVERVQHILSLGISSWLHFNIVQWGIAFLCGTHVAILRKTRSADPEAFLVTKGTYPLNFKIWSSSNLAKILKSSVGWHLCQRLVINFWGHGCNPSWILALSGQHFWDYSVCSTSIILIYHSYTVIQCKGKKLFQ